MTRKWWTLTAVAVATFMLILDITVVNTALPTIARDLHGSFTDVQWVVDAYALALAAFVLTAGSLGDRLGRRRVFLAGLGIFTIASLLCGISATAVELNIARALEGIGAAVMFAVSLALLAHDWRGAERATATAVYGASIGVAIAIGPLIGGVLTSGPGWRWIFFLNVPVGIATAWITTSRIAESRDEAARSVDWAGAITFCAANFLLVFALLRGNDYGWTSARILGLFALSLVLFAAFAVLERRAAQPMLPLGLFRTPAFTGAQLVAVAISGSVFAEFLYITLYMQEILHLSPLQAGLRYLPSTVTAFLVAAATAGLQRRVAPRYTLAAGLVLAGAGMLALSGVGPNDPWTVILPGGILIGVSLGLVNPVLANVALSAAPERISGVASGTNDTFRQGAVAAGVAGLGALLIALDRQFITSQVPGLGGHAAVSLAEAGASGGLPSGLPGALLEAARAGFTHGFDVAAVVAAALALAGALAALLLVRDRDLVHAEVADPVAHRAGGASLVLLADQGSLAPLHGQALHEPDPRPND